MTSDGFASSFSLGWLLGQIAWLLLVLAVMTSRMTQLRAMIAVAAALGLAQALLWSGDRIAAFWWGLLLLASLALVGRRFIRDRGVRFTPDEEAMLSGVLAGLSRSRARHLLDQGFWLSGRGGDTLTREDEAVSHLFYLSVGEARVTSHGRQVGTCRGGDLIGEVTVLTGDQASATVTLVGPARFWCAPANVLRPYLNAHDDARRVIERGFTASLKTKLRQSNEAIAASGGLPA